jgi:hypothetical protein
MATGTKSNTSKRVAFNWPKLKSMWDNGKSYLEMAKALDSHFNSQGDDPTKATRARCSIAMTKGVKIDGKLIRFKRRSKPHTDKEAKPKITATKQGKKPTAKTKIQKPKASIKKAAKVTVITPEADKPVQATEA